MSMRDDQGVGQTFDRALQEELPLCSLEEVKPAAGKKAKPVAGLAVAVDTAAVVDRALQIAPMLTGGVCLRLLLRQSLPEIEQSAACCCVLA